jgi:hypothetical protein
VRTAPLGDFHAATGGKRGRLRAAGVACAAAFFLCAASHAQSPSPRHDSPARGAAGVIIEYQEGPGANLLYLEEKGGMVSRAAGGRETPVEVAARKAQDVAQAADAKLSAAAAKASAAPAKVAAARAKASAAPTRVAQRRAPPPDGAGNRP